MLPWLLVRIGTATSVEGKLEETVVQESNSICKWTKYDRNKAVPAVHGRLWLSRYEKILQASQKNCWWRRDGSGELLEHAKSLLTIYHIGFVSSLCNTVLLALIWWVEVSEIHLSFPLTTPRWSHYSSWCEVSFTWLSYVTSPNLELCRAEKNTAVSISCVCAKGLCQDICT